MFTPDAIIDAVQTAKKTAVNTMVTNDVIKTALIGFVDAQTDWTKQVIKTSTSTATTIMGETVKALQEAAKFDYAKFGEGVMKAYNQMHRSV